MFDKLRTSKRGYNTMKTVIKYEHLNRYDFFPCKAHIYRNGVEIDCLFLDMLTDSRLNSADELKRELRRANRKTPGGERLQHLAVADGEGGLYTLAYNHYYKNIATEYEIMKQLKSQLERERPYTVVMTTANGKTEFKHNYKIVYVNSNRHENAV